LYVLLTRVGVDGKLYANLEHAIEKSNSDKLIECVPNIGLSCPVCNQTFKRIGEKKRKIPKRDIDQYEESSKCSTNSRKQCTVPCKALRRLQKNTAVLLLMQKFYYSLWVFREWIQMKYYCYSIML
jgi:hypothetical protein